MKKILCLLLAGTFFSVAAQAKGGDCMMQGGFYDADAATMSVADVMAQPNDAFVYMKGRIVKRVGKDKYDFTDDKNNMIVEIENKVWRNQTISPKDTVILYGEVDKEDNMTTVDVKSINLMH